MANYYKNYEGGSLIGIKEGYKDKNFSDLNPYLLYIINSIVGFQFEWGNLPTEGEQITERKIEDFTSEGNAIFFKVGDYYFCQPCVQSSGIDTQGDPFLYKPIALNGVTFPTMCVKDTVIFDSKTGTTKEYKKNAVLIRNNKTSTPTFLILKPLIEELNYIWNSIGNDIALSRAKMIFHAATANTKDVQMNELKRLFDGRRPYAVVSDKNFINDIDTLKTDVNISDISVLWDSFDKCFQMLLTALGVNNNPQQDKGERNLVDEVNANNFLIYLIRENAYESRKTAALEINELFGLDIYVIPRENRQNLINEASQEDQEQEDEETKQDAEL